MKIIRSLNSYIILDTSTVHAALEKMKNSRQRVIFIVSEHGRLRGVLSGGDVIRWLTTQNGTADLTRQVTQLMNTDFKFRKINSEYSEIESDFKNYIDVIPLLDDNNHLVALALKDKSEITIGNFVINDNSPVFIIAEIGINHNGDFQLAKQIIDHAADAGADCAKFQMRNLEQLYLNTGNPDDPREDVGSQYTLDVLTNSRLSKDQMFSLFDYCRNKNIIPLCTAWDINSAEALKTYGMDAYKIASADMTNHDLIEFLSRDFKPMILSTGMSTETEIKETVLILKNLCVPYILMHCNSTYPAPYKDVNLNYVDRLKEIGNCPVGYSGHERGYDVPIAAVARGCKVIEKHFTLDKTLPGNDHKVSLLPEEFKAMVESIRNIEASMGNASVRKLTQGEKMNREVLAKSLVAKTDIKKGTCISHEMIDVKGPGKGLQPNHLNQLVGEKAIRDVNRGDFFYQSDLDSKVFKNDKYNFNRPWGIPVRFHDYKNLSIKANMDFLEFHLTYKDLEIEPDRYFDKKLDFDLVVHSPDLFSGDHLLNLAADDGEYRQRSVSELQKVINMARRLRTYFNSDKDVLVVASVGGFTKNRALEDNKKEELYSRIFESFAQLDQEGVEIIPQTLPPYPWYFGGQLFCNIFVDADDTAKFCQETGYRVCFDVSHSKLSSNQRNTSFARFTDLIAPYTAHLHLVDASGVDGEGLQIGEGDIDFSELAKKLDHFCPDAGFIPEIWQGHKNEGEGFWIALSRLEKWF